MHSRKWNLRKSPSCPYFWKVTLKLGCSSSLWLIKVSVRWFFLQVALWYVCGRCSGIYKAALGLDNEQLPFKTGADGDFHTGFQTSVPAHQAPVEQCTVALATSSSVKKRDLASPWTRPPGCAGGSRTSGLGRAAGLRRCWSEVLVRGACPASPGWTCLVSPWRQNLPVCPGRRGSASLLRAWRREIKSYY